MIPLLHAAGRVFSRKTALSIGSHRSKRLHPGGLRRENISISCRHQHAAWVRIMTKEYEQLVAMDRKGKKTVLSKYGATNPAEFFAVSAEAFFEKPRQIREKHPQLYQQLKTYFNQDPAARLDHPPSPPDNTP